MKVWDGTSPTRPDIFARKAPDGDDWKTITHELQVTQEFLVSLAENADAMPNLVEEIKAKGEELKSLQHAISKLTVPEDVIVQVDELAERMEELSNVYQHAADVLGTVQFLQQQLVNLGKRMDAFEKELRQQVTSFRNKTAHWQQVNEERWNKRLAELEKQSGAIALALGIKSFGE